LGVQTVSATATHVGTGNTSEFSHALLVNSNGDAGSLGAGAAGCDTGNSIANGWPECTLRAAIEVADVLPGRDVIHFNLPDGDHTITLGELPLPSIDQPIVIDASTQPGFTLDPVVTINGAAQLPQFPIGVPSNIGMLHFKGGNSELRGLALEDANIGIAVALEGDANKVVANRIGNIVPVELVPSANVGIVIMNGNGNLIGDPTERFFSGNSPSSSLRENQNVIIGNLVGLEIRTGNNTKVQGNFIGVDRNAVGGRLPNRVGIRIRSGNNTLIGGSHSDALTACSGPCNLISGHNKDLLIPGALPWPSALPDDDETGIVLHGGLVAFGPHPDGTTIVGNFIGTNAVGDNAIGNGRGIALRGAANTTIESNLISGNNGEGVFLVDDSNTVIKKNHIGLGNGIQVSVPNALSGIHLQNPSGLTIGGIGSLDFNRIAFNHGSGIAAASSVGKATILGNFIHDNGVLGDALGLDLGPTGVTENDVPDNDGQQNFPVLAPIPANFVTIVGTLDSTFFTNYRVEVFANNADDIRGEARGLAGSVDFTGDLTSPTSFTLNVSFAAAAYSATATNLDTGQTSELSPIHVVAP
jgi:parallel beta-helix repeat protein